MIDAKKGSSSKASFVIAAVLFLCVGYGIVCQIWIVWEILATQIDNTKFVLTSWLSMGYWTIAGLLYFAGACNSEYPSSRIVQVFYLTLIAVVWPFLVVNEMARDSAMGTKWALGNNEQRIVRYLTWKIFRPFFKWSIFWLATVSAKFTVTSDSEVADKGSGDQDCRSDDDTDSGQSGTGQQDLEAGSEGGATPDSKGPSAP